MEREERKGGEAETEQQQVKRLQSERIGRTNEMERDEVRTQDRKKAGCDRFRMSDFER